MAREIEVKIELGGPEGVAARIEACGGRLLAPRLLEDNRIFDRPDGALGREGRLLRLREVGGRCVLTAKAPLEGISAYKARREEETDVPDAGRITAALETAGFVETWRYQKYRTSWSLDGATVTLDEIPHGCFLEIEGEGERIDAVAGRLGFERSAYRKESYRELHRKWCARHDTPFGDLVFPVDPRG